MGRLLGEHHQVVMADSLLKAETELSRTEFSMMLLDIQMPDGDGLSFYAKLQTFDHARNTPVIFITSTRDPSHEITGFSLGADDFLSKPINTSTFRSRIDARLKQRADKKKRDLTLQRGDLRMSLSLQKGYLLSDGNAIAIKLTPVEFKPLFHLLRFEEQVFSRDQLLSTVWGNAADVFDRTVDMHVSKLRKKIAASEFKIEAVHGSGYRLTKDSTKEKDNPTK
jgi:DNA-binding response OmpR family regulator